MANVIPLIRPEARPRISVIMVSYMTGPALLEAVAAVISDPEIFELIIVDNGNTYDARKKLSQLTKDHDRIRLVQSHGNIGFAKGCNYGATIARGTHFLFLNPDAIMPVGAAMSLADCADQHDIPCVVGGRLSDVNGQEQRGSRRADLTPWSVLISFTPLSKLPFFSSLHLEKQPIPDNPIEVPIVSGACLLMDRYSFEEMDGFNEEYFLHVEDIDLCRRVRKKGGKVIFNPHANIMHYGSTSQAKRQDVEYLKFRGLFHYFHNYSDKVSAKVLNIIAAPFLFTAMMLRAWYLVLRKAFIGH